MPPPQTTHIRPRSALQRSDSSQRSTTTPVDNTREVGSSNATRGAVSVQPKPAPGDTEGNIRVVIRCRRRSEREIQDNSPIIVTTNGPKGEDITVEASVPTSTFGVVALPTTRTYPFDMVFGPEADQATVYNDVVHPMLEEVLLGYNCTLFAYGQTGTGKTHTMQGDLTTTPLGNPSQQAGMIPRVLFKLFQHLEATCTDFSVKISFVELYNEELRDLLAPELQAPSGSNQPMGMGVQKDTSQQVNLKLFDDSKKGGVIIQGLEETPVRTVTDALALLTKGSHRRQIAATKFNDHSSRSHSVFSITIHTTAASTTGDGLLRVGKLNLVDLAGSENIGRSGAENKRAREAGMINQSLLTLGRVINALVDNSPHVPYRESKLTRLLQDSLGGRTKTCIIATVSPARSNMEETLSTLDYAIRAKSIKNRPEVNQQMTRNALIKDYVAEITRLHADLRAVREKSGIIISEESWAKMTAEQELKETERLEAVKQVEILEGQMKAVREEFEEAMTLLARTDEELRETKVRLEGTTTELVGTKQQLAAVEGALEEEIYVRQVHQTSEETLHGIVEEWKDIAREYEGDVTGLFSKLDRKTAALGANVKAVGIHSKTLANESQTMSSKVDTFMKAATQHLNKVKTETEQFQNKEIEALSVISNRIKEQLEKVQESLKLIQAKEETSKETIDAMKTTITEAQETMKTGFTAYAEELRQHCEFICQEAETSSLASCSVVEKTFQELGTLTEAIKQEALEFIATERKALQEAKALADNTTNTEILRLKQQNVLLTRLLETERVEAKRSADALLERIAGLLGDYTNERDRSLRETFSEMTGSNTTAEYEMQQLGQRQGQQLDAAVARGSQWSEHLTKRGVEGKRLRDGGIKSVNAAKQSIRDGLAEVQEAISSSTSEFAQDVQRIIQGSNTTLTQAFDREHRAKRARIEATDGLVTEAQSGYRYMQRGLASTSRSIEGSTNRILSEMSGMEMAVDALNVAASTTLGNIRRTTQSLAEEGTREDKPTGSTPRKRGRRVVEDFPPTESRDVLVRRFRARGVSSVGSETFLAEHLPLPDGGEAQSPTLDGMVIDSPVDGAVSDEENRFEATPTNSPPPLVKSLASSSSSSTSASTTASIPVPAIPSIPVLKQPTKLGTLTERSTNVGVRTRPQRSRRTVAPR
ncbi:kinesin-domain-containing protein [Dichomitus squalens LYAD-421 SS1]|uniref:kinesin-domain-containing protein n=1 Tax=Dichomitus squalens (strain LYAD-421) TaxID=732165 RepID=UPI0004414A89|nr:kinesin-domain-containing protein [Dichomitus squalens LYAD-421 SS1]EJF65955.1 kinesin-domain-containing protein [Dichomitus squalens LYAD-421 SS1]